MADGITSGIEDIDMSLSGMRQLSGVITKKAQTEQTWATNYAEAEQKKRDELISQMGEVKIVNAQQAYLDYGFEIPQGYNLKITPTLIGEGEGGIPNYEYNISYLAPDGWEITGAGEYISPDGLMTTDQWGYMQIIYDKQLAELQAAAPEGYEFVPEAQPDFTDGYVPPAGQYLPTQDTVNQYYDSVINSSVGTATGFEPTGTIIDDLPTDKESYLTSEQAATLGYEIDEGWQLKLSPVVTAEGVSFMPTVVTPGGFELIRDEMGNDLFVSPTGEVIKADDVINPAAVGITVENPYDIPDDLKPEYALQWLADGTMKYEYLPDAVQLKVNYLLSDPEALFEYFKDNVPYQEGVGILLNLFPDIDPAQLISIYMQDVYPQAEEWSFWGQIQGGIGDLRASLSGMMDWLGWDAAADFLMTNTKEWQSKAVGYEGDATGWGVLFDPAWWGTTALRGAPATVGLILAGALTATGIGAVAGTGFWASVAAAVGGASASRMLESAIEAGGTYNEAINSGKSEQEASDMAQSVFNKNLSLVGLDAVQFGLAFTPLGKAVSSLAAKGLVKTAIIGGEAVITAVTEAGEEYLQEVFQRMARGDTDPWATDEEMQEIMALGGAMGLFFMGSGKVTEALKSNVLRNISPELYQQYIKAYTDAVAAGNTEQQASQIALDELAKTGEGKAAIQIAASAATTEIISNQLQRITGDQTVVAQIPSTDKILDNALKSSWQSKLAQRIGSTAIGSNLIRAIDPRAEISRTSAEIKDVVGRAAIVRNHMMAAGINMGESFKLELRDISDKPSELFQFDNRGVSKTLSEGLTSDKPGTLEDIFLHPDKYRLTPRQKAYIDKMMVLVERGKNFLRQEGLYEYSDNFGEWIHRVVVGRTDENGKPVLVKGKPGRGSKSIGATRAYEKARQHETQAEGVADGVYYDPNPENWMGTYLEDVFIKIGDARFANLIEEYGESPSAILDRIRPDLKEKVELTKEQLAHITKLQSLSNQASRIKVGTIPASSIRSVARHFPELVGRLNKLLPKNSNAYNQAIQYAAELENVNKLSRQYINDLEAQTEQLRKGIIPASIPEQAALPEQQVPKLSSYELPERSILEQGFIMMSPEQRNSLMQVYQAQLDNMERDMYFLEEETAGLKEAIEDFFGRTGVRRLEIVQQLWNRIQKRKDELRRITVKEYKDVTGRKTTGNVPIIIGEGGHKYISWEDALDGIVREFGFDDSEALYDALEKNAGLIAQVRKAEDKAYEMKENHRALKMTIDALANVSITNQEHIPADITGEEMGVTPAQVPVVITQAMQAQLEAFGYSQDEINKMTPEQAWDLINGTMAKPAPSVIEPGQSLAELKEQLADMLKTNEIAEVFSPDEIAEVEKAIADMEETDAESQLIRYADSLISDEIQNVYLVGSSLTSATPKDIDIIYEMNIALGEDAERAVEEAIERSNINLDLYDTFIKVGGRYFHVSSGAGRQVIENTEYGKEQSGKPRRRLNNTTGNRLPISPKIRLEETVLGKNSYALSIYSNEKYIASASFSIYEDGTAKIGYVSSLKGQPISLSEWKATLSQMREKYPQIKRIEGDRKEVSHTVELPEQPTELVEGPAIPKAEAGMPEAGLSKDFWGYEAPVFPQGKGEVTQISMDDQVKLQEYYKQQGKQMPDATYAVVPVNSIEQLAAAPQFVELQPQAPSAMSENQRQAELKELIRDIKLIKAGRLDAYNIARSERRYELEKTRQAGILKGYIMQPMFGGKIYDDAFIEEINKWYLDNKGSKILGKISEVAGTLRVTKAALDFSGMFIQGLPAWGLAHSYLFVNPKMGLKMLAAWYKAFVISTASFFAPHISYRYLKENAPARMQRAAFGGSTRAIDIFAGLNQKGFVTNLLSHKWSPFKRAEVAFVTGGEYVRNSFWEIMKDQAIKNGDEQQLVMFLDRLTGVMNTEAMGVPALARQIESSFIWFAPQYTRACLSVINHIFKGGYNGKQARRALGGMITAGSMFYMAVLFAQGLLEGKDEEDIWERILEGFGWTTDPITGEGRWAPNARFMSIEVGDRNYGIGGFWYGLVRLAGNISSVIQEEGSREIIDFVKIIKDGKLNRDNPFVYWWYSRSSPFTGMINDLATHRDFLGYPIETWEQYLTYIATRFEPIWMESAINPLLGIGHDEPGEPDGTILNILGELFGLRVNQKYAWQQFYEKAEELITHMTRDELNENQIEAWEKGKLGWKQLDERQQAQLLDRYPELKELMDAAEADSALRDDSIWAAWNERIDVARTTYYDEVASLGEQLKQGLISTAKYREKLSDAGLKYGASISTIESDPQYAEIYEYLSENSENGAEYEFEFSQALADYNKNIRFADDLEDENGNYDWDLRDARVKAFIEKWGMEMYDGILKYFELKKKEQGADELYLKKVADIEKIGREYWDIEPDAKDLDGKDLRAAYRNHILR